MATRAHTAVDLFCGAGGLSLGFKLAGFSVLQAVELDTYAARTYQLNHPEVSVVQADITTAPLLRTPQHLDGSAPLTALIAGPPCQGFSESNRRTRSMDNPGNALYREVVRFAEAYRPKWVVIENVVGIKTLGKGALLGAIRESLARLGYETQSFELVATDFGVPQVRRRVFVIGRIGYLRPVAIPLAQTPVVSVRQAIGDLPSLSVGNKADFARYQQDHGLPRYAHLMRRGMKLGAPVSGNLTTNNAPHIVRRFEKVPPGSNWEAIPPEMLSNYANLSTCHTGIYHRLEWDRPAKVIGNFRKNMLIHPGEDRGLSIREAARLQSFPDDYRFLGPMGFQQQQVADAVPPLLAMAVAASILKAEDVGEQPPEPEMLLECRDVPTSE